MTLRSISGATLPKTAALRIAPMLLLCLAACSSPKAPKRSEFGPSYKERYDAMVNVIKNKDDSMRSSFEKSIPKSTTEKSYKASAFNAKDAAGMKKFSGTDSAYGAKDFAGAGKKSRIEAKTAREAEERNRLASQMFRTPDNRFDAKASPEGGKTFTQGNGTFATRENRAGTKELEKNKKPVMQEPDKSTYSEDDVKRLLNKG